MLMLLATVIAMLLGSMIMLFVLNLILAIKESLVVALFIMALAAITFYLAVNL